MAVASSLGSIADSMLASAAAVLSHLVDRSVQAHPAKMSQTKASIQVRKEGVATIAEVPSLGIHVVIRFVTDDLAKIVGIMVGAATGGDDIGAMQLSIVAETVVQVSTAMAEQLATDAGVSREGVRAEVCTDATGFPAPPFETYEGGLEVADLVSTVVAIDFDGVALAKIGAGGRKTEREGSASGEAQSVAFSQISPTQLVPSPPGQANLELVHDIPLQISAVLGKTALSLRDVVALQTGSIFELDKNSSDPIDLYVNNILIARGEVVVVDDKFAVKISELSPPTEKA